MYGSYREHTCNVCGPVDYDITCNMGAPVNYDVILGAVCQAVCRSTTYDTLSGVRGNPSLDKGTKVVQRATDVVDKNVVGCFQ